MITAPTAKAITMPDRPFPPLELAELDVEFVGSVEFDSDDDFDADDCEPCPDVTDEPSLWTPYQEQANINAKKIIISNTFIFIFK